MAETVTASRRGVLDFSPVKRDDANKENDVPILSLIQFSKAPFVTFGSVKLGSSKSAVLRIENPTEDAEAEVNVEKIPSSKGFSVDHNTFTIQPEGSFSLTVTWTPSEEGGIRELIIFNANGVLKHQAVLLGRAEAPKKKKVNILKLKKRAYIQIFDSDRATAITVRERSLSKHSPVDDYPQISEEQKALNSTLRQRSLVSSDQENIHHVQRNSPLVLLVPAGKLMDSGNMSASPDALAGKPESKDLTKMLNRTLSPIGTPEMFRKLMPHIQSDSPLSATVKSVADADGGDSVLTGSPVLSLKDALALIDSDLSQMNTSPRDTSSSCGFSDSLESKSGNCDRGPDKNLLRALPDSPLEFNEPRLTFFVSKNAASEVVVSQADKSTERVKKASFTSATVTKSKAPVEANSSSGRKIKKSRRRLLEKTLELSDGSSQCESRPDTPSLPVIDPDTGIKGWLNPEAASSLCDDRHQAQQFMYSSLTPQLDSPLPSIAPARFSFSVTSPPPTLAAPIVFTTAKIVAVAQSKLTFVKPAQTAIPRHPMPFAAKNMFYDERWIEKQERGFTWWINYVLTPDDFKVNTEVAKVNAVSIVMGSDDKYSVPKAPTREEMSFSTYTARRKLNRLRRSACQLFTSEAMVKAIQRLELEVEAKRLLVRKDRHLWKDIGERRKVLNWLLSYNPLWLRIGLETIYGELISLESNSDALGLAMFVLQRLLWNPDIAAQYRHAKVPNLYKEGHEEALSRFTLKKLLLLVCFLDKAKESRLIEHNPCLFCLDAEFKTTKDLLLAFSRDFLSGEGILPRHLGYLGLPVSHVQTPLDEFNFAVKNLAVDLKCGIRLVRVMELLVQDWSLSAKLRLPAISRLQKIHNVDMALQVLKSKGVDLKDEHGSIIDSRDVVDGHREKTLSLLWKIIFAFHVILDEDQLREEIYFLKKTLRTKQRLMSLRADRGLQPSPVRTRAAYEHSSTKVTLLMDWARAVCDFYSLKVENFTVTFSDGRVLCYLIHHYHPSLLPEKAVSQSTTQTVECSQRGRLELDCSASDSDNSFDTLPAGLNGTLEFKELLENEKNNFRMVNSAVSFLGGVPAMINPADMSNTIPNEKVVMSYLSFLCARLLDLRNETRAARVIQGAWRKYRLKKDLQLYKVGSERNVAAMKIQLVVRRFLEKCRVKRQNQAAGIIQSVWRGYVARNRLRLKKQAQLRALQNKAATVIQVGAQWKMISAMRAYYRLRYYAIVAQKTEKENHAATVIQAVFKKWYKEKMAERANAAVRIQSWYRMQRCLHQYKKIKASTLLIQAQYRGRAQRRCFRMLKLQHHSAIVIQSAFRGHAARKLVAKMRCATVTIQRWFRASVERDVERQMFVRMRCAAITIQAAYRGKVARESLKKQHKAATVIQASFRRYAAQRRYFLLRKAAAVIQQKYRATLLARETKKDYDALRNAALTVQANWRGRADRKRIEKRHQCATLIQAYYRRHKAEAEYRSKKAAAVVIQHRYRAYVAGKEMRKAYLHRRAACITLQAGFRGLRDRIELKKRHWAATVIQSSVRMFLCSKQYILIQSAAIIIQSRYRALVACRAQQNEYKVLKQAAIKIQAVYRGFRVREDLKKRHRASTAIQAQFRMHRMRMAYLATKCAAIIIQEHFRAKMLKDQQMQRYTTMKSAAVLIQAAYRGYRARRKIAEMHRAATMIQRKFLTIRDRNRFLAIKAAALVCQQRYRAVALARKDHLDYLVKRRAVICLQAAYRGREVRKQMRIQHTAAVTIQSQFRKYQQRTYYKKLHSAASVLQARYRANKKMREEMQALSAKRNAAVVLQAAFRGMKSRQIIKQRHQAASVIQRAYGAHYERKQYLTLKSSVLTIQRRYRAIVAAKAQMKQYQRMRTAAVLLQAAYRGQQVRKEIAHRHQAATIIQSVFRKHREVVKFQAMRLSAIIIQRHYRSCILQRQVREKFIKIQQATIILQAAYRGHCVRSSIAKMHKAATVIQTNFKRHKQQSAFRRQHWAACVLQQRFRAQRQRNVEIKHYQQRREAAIVLQAAYRGMKSRWIIKQRHQAASVIQRAYRTHCEHKQYLTLKSSILTIQRRYRATVAAKKQMQKYQKMRSAAIVLQAAYRGQQGRREIAQYHWAATVIQSAFRKHREEVKFQAIRLSAIIIQRHYRSCILQKRDRETFLERRHSAVVLQAAYRGQQVRKEVARWHQAAIAIQSAFRKHREEVKFQAMRLSAVIIQRYYRSCILQRKERENFLKARHSAIVLQAAFRGHLVRTSIAKMHKAATVIQANFKRHKHQSSLWRHRWAACVLQQRFRAKRQRNIDIIHYQNCRKAAIVLQAAYRGMKSRQNIKQSHQAASVIQRAYRTHCEHMQYLTLKSTVLTIQRWYRATVAAKEQMQKYQKMQRSAVLLQAAYRGKQVRREMARWHWAATVIQSAFRKHREEVKFQAIRLSTIIIQRYYRACILRRKERKNFLKARRSAIALQAAFRGHRVRANIAKLHRSATVIQANFKRHKQQSAFRRQRWAACVLQQRFKAQRQRNVEIKHYHEVRKAVINLQAAFRAMKSRRIIKQRHQAASVVQRAYRAYSERKQYLKLKLSVLTIQQKYRATLAAKAQRTQYLEMRCAAIIVQSAYRGKRREEVKFQAMRLSAIIIQRYYRSCILQRKERENFLKARHSAIILQAAFRGWCVRRDISQQNQAAIVIQSCWKCSVQRRIFQRKREAAVKLQQRVRAVQLGRLERNNYTQSRRAAITLQTHCRAWIARQKNFLFFLPDISVLCMPFAFQVLEVAKAERRLRFTSAVFHHLKAIKIQRALRAHWALESAKRQIHSVITIQQWVRARQQRRRYLEDRSKVVTAQRAVKRWLARRHKAASVIQQAVQKFLLLRRQKRVQQGIVKAQALWRGHRSRRLNDNPKVVKLRHRLRKVSADIREEDKLCNKTSSALDYLLRYKHFSYILEALKNLETATRLSPECCERLVESGATNIIFTLIRCCNRSVPCMDVITFSIQILLNLSKYHKTIEAVYSVENSVETLLDLLQRYREKAGDKVAEKGGSIFTKACFLLALLLQDNHRAVEVMKLPKVLDRIRSIYRLTARKHKMDAERTVVKQKMSASINGSFFAQATPRKSRPVPKFAPEWVLRKDKLNDVVDPLRAIQMVANTLSIVL
uniref:Assembly factor for spindle microtubules n=1 Tax=Dicentrarchus labrax TaxID=13489 RepID=A0A8P4K3C9_DICLA